MVNFDFASSSSFRDLPKSSFCGCEVGDGTGDMNAICSRPEVLDDVIFGKDVDTFQEYVGLNLWGASFIGFQEN